MFWKNRKVFLTGHTGFKGSWLSLWLQQLGAQVTGYALAPSTDPNLFEAAQVASCLHSVVGDIRDLQHLQAAILEQNPEIVFHLAAQPLVRASYEDPIYTYQTNVLGTANLLEAIRACESVRAVVIITTDKCYENREWPWAYREVDALGGYDPYSSSKACAELVVNAYRTSFFSHTAGARGVALATARAGNVIGGGDWSPDRLLADIVRTFSSGQVLKIRNPGATRPWQHVLEPLRGYLMLAQLLYLQGAKYGGSWNFGPEYSDAKSVEWIVDYMIAAWQPAARWERDGGDHPHEAQMLKLDWSKAAQELGWRPALRLTEALDLTIHWYRDFLDGNNSRDKCLQQISGYCDKSCFADSISAKGMTV